MPRELKEIQNKTHVQYIQGPYNIRECLITKEETMPNQQRREYQLSIGL